MIVESKQFTKEAEILNEIRESEKKADEIMDRAIKEKESILQESIKRASAFLIEKQTEIDLLKDRKIAEFKENSKFILQKKIEDARIIVAKLKSDSEKEISNGTFLIIKKFEENLN